MKVLTAAQMREVDRRTIEMGIPGIVLMENAGHRVVEFLEKRFRLAEERIVVLCGKGNNGGDGMVIARQLWTRIHPKALHVVLFAGPAELKGDAAANFHMLKAYGCPVLSAIPPEAHYASLVIDAILGTGVSGPAKGQALDAIREANDGFPLARVVAVDIPSGLSSDFPEPPGEFVRAAHTVTFTAPKVGQVMPPGCDYMGQLVVCPIGSPPSLYEEDGAMFLSLVEPAMFRKLLVPRPPSGHKGTFGHVLVVGGSRGKTGAAAMAGIAALRAGAGLVTVAAGDSTLPVIASHAPELMTEPLPENEDGGISQGAAIERLGRDMTVIAMGPGMGRHPDTEVLALRAAAELEQPIVFDADTLTPALGPRIRSGSGLRVMTPHPGEMARLTGKATAEVQRDRITTAREFAQANRVVLILKGQRSLIAFPDGAVWINPTGTPAMGTGGSGDILTGLLSGFLAQFPGDAKSAIAAAVYLGGLAAEIGARELGEKPFIATDALRYLPRALEECAGLSHGV